MQFIRLLVGPAGGVVWHAAGGGWVWVCRVRMSLSVVESSVRVCPRARVYLCGG